MKLAQSQRLVSLDVFRGITIAGMILVNNPGSWEHMYAPLKHADWHGWTPTDLVFPFFLFIVGVAIVFALSATVEQGKSAAIRKVLIRSAKIFGLGLFMAAYPFWDFETMTISKQVTHIRIMGVLQRIALCYLIASLLFLYVKPINIYRIAIALLLGYWGLMTWVEVPGYGAGNIDSEFGNLAAYIDRLILTENHLWAGAERKRDPEGLLSTLPAVVTVIIGLRAGLTMKNQQWTNEQKTVRLFAEGCLLVIIGYVWDWFFPINKPLWTSSYAVFTGGQAMCGLALCYYFVDQLGYSRWAYPFQVYGVNAIIVFVLSGVLSETLGIFKVTYEGKEVALGTLLYLLYGKFLSAKDASLAYALTWVSAWYVVLWQMFKRNIIIKV
ncbi:MAG: heparan-alpha-glucosaminide N-acetyltransferase domain-containing protein [Cytophagales bacterium]|nr:heparan-alpha-glucosaminide N-acetyltransferase domain-containing protein [Bernardetiaceae bacterium]MDW8205532.1 heparan-alpha-glucosaminide N-acetyltransferase domain-containing protein [Cytophagales bacterium]